MASNYSSLNKMNYPSKSNFLWLIHVIVQCQIMG